MPSKAESRVPAGPMYRDRIVGRRVGKWTKSEASIPPVDETDPDHAESVKLPHPPPDSERAHAGGADNDDPLRHRPEEFPVPDSRSVFRIARRSESWPAVERHVPQAGHPLGGRLQINRVEDFSASARRSVGPRNTRSDCRLASHRTLIAGRKRERRRKNRSHAMNALLLVGTHGMASTGPRPASATRSINVPGSGVAAGVGSAGLAAASASTSSRPSPPRHRCSCGNVPSSGRHGAPD